MAVNTMAGRSFARRDQLLKIQSHIQKLWEEEKIFEATARSAPLDPADKLAREMEQYGNPPLFPLEEDFTDEIEESKIEEGNLVTPDKFKSKRSKATAKSRREKFHGKMRKLKGMGKIVKDMRYTIYSPLDGQPCADHDRASGEGVQPQDYVLIKMEVIPPFPLKFKMLEGRNIFLAVATLRPEIMSTLNLAYQKVSRVPEKATCLLELSGLDLIGLRLKSPLSFNPVIYALPMLTILPDKGTGILTSVPSDSPDDYMALKDLKSKEGLRSKFGVKDEWVLSFDIIPIINIPDFGDKSAEKVCHDLKIKSQKDKEKLVEAKRLTYLKGFTDGRMLVGDECVVALTDQWYITYGEEWKKKAEDCLSNMKLYSEETRHGFEHTLSWLNQWACSRSFGLGTQLPWDEQFLVESLSDSIFYMAYYTIDHLLQDGNMYGSVSSSITPEKMADEVWNYIFVGGQSPTSDIPSSILNQMKQEFEYWYPFDLHVSGKDLIQNHLTFCIYNHTALVPSHYWPRGFRCNGHIMLNSEKMSKSTGNFRTLRQAIEEFSTDATRFSLADAGDAMDDANFVFETANAAILRLANEISWIEEVLAADSSLRARPPSTYADHAFDKEINIAVHLIEQNYNDYMFRNALKIGFYDLQAARDEYRISCGVCLEIPLKKDGFVVNVDWPSAASPDLTLQRANKYLQDSIILMRKLLQKQLSGSKKKECLMVLQRNFDRQNGSFKSEKEILEELKESSLGNDMNMKQIQKLCMSFIKFKMDDALHVSVHALDLKLPFDEIEVLQENLDLIRRQLGLEHVEILSASDESACRKAGPFINLLIQNPPSPKNPVSIFLSKVQFSQIAGSSSLTV
ncbi:leucyl-tRNA synthetase [Dendrobium catenatum]|uniref:leucine--tRNA ligase n=1 Tax=Dendrobium catenatum TaxID=906689 RepID=A0A2I0WID8_9ASPA|nr:leucyl-tRNA synthetase [Dendrobium catenatum]